MTEKLDEISVLDAASWPAFLVDQSALIHRANAAAVDFFGAKVEGGAAPLSALWTNENGAEPASSPLRRSTRACACSTAAAQSFFSFNFSLQARPARLGPREKDSRSK